MDPHTAIPLLSVATLLSAVACIVSDERGTRPGVYVFKPLTMVFVLCVAWLGGDATPSVRNLLLAGLVLSLAGDVFLMLPSDRFVQGLASFLIAHVLYIAAFAQGVTSLHLAIALPLFVFGVAYYRWLLPDLGDAKAPVAIYVAAIAAMAWLAGARFSEAPSTLHALGFAGALLFMVSDSALAWNRFHAPLRHSPTIVLGTYFSAQWLIALSLGGGSALFGAGAG